MDKQMYDLVKQAMEQGQSLDTLMADLKATAAQVEKDTKPVHPIADRFTAPVTEMVVIADRDGFIKPAALTKIIGCYLAQKGVVPDDLFDSEGEYLDTINDALASMVDGMKLSSKLKRSVEKGMTKDFFSTLFGGLEEIFSDLD